MKVARRVVKVREAVGGRKGESDCNVETCCVSDRQQ